MIGVDLVPEEPVPVPRKRGSIKEIVMDTMGGFEGWMINYNGALENFETVVMQSSKEEAAPKSTGEIVLNEISEFVFREITDFGSKLVPGGKFVKKIIGLGENISSAIEKEKKRQVAASESNSLKSFITILRNIITTMRSTLSDVKVDDAISAHMHYKKQRSRRAKRNYRKKIVLLNKQVSTALYTDFSVDALFNRITEQWIASTKVPGKRQAARVEITLDKGWNVINAYINAPRGSRLAEQLLLTGGGKVNLSELGVPRIVTWFPQSEQEGAGLSRCWAYVSAEGKIIGDLHAWLHGKSFLNEFGKLIKTKPIPNTVKISGYKTP